MIQSPADLISARPLRLLLLPWLILALGFGAAFAVWQNARQNATQVLNVEFDSLIDKHGA